MTVEDQLATEETVKLPGVLLRVLHDIWGFSVDPQTLRGIPKRGILQIPKGSIVMTLGRFTDEADCLSPRAIILLHGERLVSNTFRPRFFEVVDPASLLE